MFDKNIEGVTIIARKIKRNTKIGNYKFEILHTSFSFQFQYYAFIHKMKINLRLFFK